MGEKCRHTSTISVLILIFLVTMQWTSISLRNVVPVSSCIDKRTEQYLEESAAHNAYYSSGTVDSSFADAPDSMIRVCDLKNQSTTIILNSQLNLTWMTVESSTIITPPMEIRNKIDTNLLNVTELLNKRYLDSNQTNVIISLSDGNASKNLQNSLSNLVDKVNTLYTSERACGQTSFLECHVNYTTVFELAENPQVTHIWLDRKFHALLDQSVPLIKDPSGWATIESSYHRSINGSGVEIAILDTGIDSTHPDFSFPNGTSKIVGAISFVTGESASDGFGHGTHCASIAAGTGAASSGQYTGVAPGASLLNVKVLDNQGEGLESSIISGIYWAVDNKANILSMSFGTDVGGDGSDPLSIAVNNVTSQGVICVIAAGNSGSEMYTTAAPGVADLAITVGASTKSDAVADFSSRGPTTDYRIKPDVVAPGVDIVAARAAGTSMGTPVSQYYTEESGTSMAAPHVAGASALLLDAHPSWSPMMVKMALANYAKDTAANVLAQGSGRIDVCKAVNASIVGKSSISFGRVNVNTQYKQVFSIQSLTSSTLNIALNIQAWHISDGTLYNVAAMNTSSLALSAGATGTVELSITTSGTLPDGYFEGVVTATFGDASIRIPFFFCILSQVNAEVADQSGSKLMAAFTLISADTGAIVAYSSEDASAQFRVGQGTYIVQAMNIYAMNPSGSTDTGVSFLVQKKLSIGIGETVNLQLSLNSAYKLDVRTTDINGSPLCLVQKQLLTTYCSMGYFADIGTLNSQSIYLTNLSEYIRPPCFFGYAGFPDSYNHWKQTGILTSEVDAYFIGWDLSTFGLSTIPSALSYVNSELATFEIETMLPESSPTSTIWFNQIAEMWQSGLWHGYVTHPGIRWTTHILPYQNKTSPTASWSQLEWSCMYAFSTSLGGAPENYVIDRHFQPITKGENVSYSIGKTPLLPQDVVDNPPYLGSGLYVPYYPLRVERNLFITKTNTQATERLEVFRNGGLISNGTRAWDQTSIPISQFLNSYGYGLYNFVVKTGTSFNYSSQNTAEYTINYMSTSTDLIPPSIIRIDCDPCFTKNDHQVGIQLADNVGISSVSLLYSIDNGPYVPAALTNLGNNCFSADLTFPTDAQKLSLIIEASDGNGNKIRFTTDPAATRGYQTRIDANLNGGTITGKLTVIGGSLLQPVYLKVNSNGQIMYTLTDANGNFAFNLPPSFVFQIEIEMSPLGTYDGSSWVINSLSVQTEPAGVASIPGGGWYILATDAVLTAPASVDSSNTHYRFSYWNVDGVSQGSGVNPITVHMDVHHTATAHYITQYTVLFTQTGLSSDATSTIVTVNGNAKALGDLPFTLWVDSGSSVTYSYNSPVSSTVSGKRFSLDSVTGPVSPITVSAPTAIAGNYKTQYHLTVRTDPTGIATIPGEGWYDEAALVTLTASTVQNFQFSYWDVDGAPQGSEINPITVSMNTVRTATAHYTSSSPLHDIAITNLATLKNIVGRGFSTIINVTVTNQGDQTTTFNVTTYANNSAVSTIINTSLPNGGSTILTFTWNTSGFVYGNYTISAYAWPVPGETNTANNNFTDGWVIVAMVGDITGPIAGVPDGKIDIRDIHLVAVNFGKTVPPGPSNCDITGPKAGVPDGKIDIRDLSLVAKNFGKTGP